MIKSQEPSLSKVSSSAAQGRLTKTSLWLAISLQLLFSVLYVQGQESIEERLLEEQAESSEQSELLEIILELKQNPIDINSAGLRELARIPVLTPKLRFGIVDYRGSHGPFKSTDDLLGVPGMTTELYELLSELVYVPRATRKSQDPRVQWRMRLTDRLEKSRGFSDGTYENSSPKIYNRIRFQLTDKIQGGLLLEKDSGEGRLDDLRLFYLKANLSKRLSLLFGNYQLEAGQGLVLWGPYGFSKSSNVIFPIRKKARGVRGYTTVDENAAFFGGSVAFNNEKFQAITFFSQSQLDATLVSDTQVSGFFSSGFHRNDLESQKKDVVTESVVGARIRYQPAQSLSIGATGYYSSFDKIINAPNLTRKRFEFRGKSNHVAGVDWQWSSGEATVFGEMARSRNGGTALIAAALWDFGATQLAFLFRDYKRDFQNLHGFGFGNSNGTTQNERGYYTGLQYKATSKTVVRAFYDIFENPWRTFFEPLPTDGRDFLIELEQRFARDLRLTLRFRDKISQETAEFLDSLNRPAQEFVEVQKNQWRLQLDYRLSRAVRIRSRVEYVTFEQNRFQVGASDITDKGMALSQEIRVRPSRNWQVNARMTFFDTDSFDARVFQYEHDLPGVVTNRALFGRGNRWYAVVKYTPSRLLAFSTKYSETLRDDVEVIGSGPDRIESNVDRRFGVQMEVKL